MDREELIAAIQGVLALLSEKELGCVYHFALRLWRPQRAAENT